MIKSINIKDVATFDSVNGVQINDLKKVNFFFGYNGSGKSTIAKYLHSLSLDVNNQNQEFKNCSNIGYSGTEYQILTFNDDFIKDHFIRKNELNGIFSLDAKNDKIDILIKEEIDKKTLFEKNQQTYVGRIKKLILDKDKNEKKLTEYCWTKRNTFHTFREITLDFSNNKINHKNKIITLLKDIPDITITLENITENYNALFEKEIRHSENIELSKISEILNLEIQIDALLNEVIIGNTDVDISELINSLNSNSWVSQGINYLIKTKNVCPFCQKETIDEDLKSQFSKYFDEAYKTKIDKIKTFKNTYVELTSNMLSMISNIKDVFNPKNIISDFEKSLNTIFDKNLKTIDEKITSPNERKKLNLINSKEIEIQAIINLILENNNKASNLEFNKKSLLEDIWKYMAKECQNEINKFNDRENKYKKLGTLATELQEKWKERILETKNRIDELRTQTKDTKKAVENINHLLKSSGFEGFEIFEKDKVNNISRYVLRRPNVQNNKKVFETLSEGEKNFITFLYFYQLCLGAEDLENNTTKKKIFVIDDPVSSLDSQALFIITTLIREMIKKEDDNKKEFKDSNLEQVFILTHNFYFYKEVSLNLRRTICQEFQCYSVKKTSNKSHILKSSDKDIRDDYTLMWDTLYNIKNNDIKEKSNNILIANTMRRIIESYVNFVGIGNTSWNVLNEVDPHSPEYYLMSAFISLINDESHKVNVFDSLYYQRIVNENPGIIFQTFETVFMEIGKDHYKKMMKEETENYD